MHLSLKYALISFGSLASLAICAPASAACGDAALLKPSAFHDNASSLFKPVNGIVSIVGMWSVRFVLPNGGLFDFGYAQWHNDGTEILNSGSRAPSTQNFCLGVWTQEGPFKYKLNHFALGYDPAGSLNGLVNIKEEVVVIGDSYSGPFTVDVYNPSNKALVAHVAGTVFGKRVTVNSGP